MRKKKRRGSSLIFVVFVAALIFTTGAALLTAVTADYKARVNASVQLKNLYAADSGIDLVKNARMSVDRLHKMREDLTTEQLEKYYKNRN